ncbi:MAG: hypothetical protein EOP51_16090 [Sphingobacteriales bacterium]|nr:MAG: hypothetical protein EOP51_16090 [Sphingobacteriales bacterium]
MSALHRTVTIVILCLLMCTTAHARFTLNFYPQKFNQQQLIQNDIDAAIWNVIGELPLRLTDLQQQWVKPPYTQLNCFTVYSNGEPNLCNRFGFDSLGRVIEHEGICDADSTISYVTYCDNEVLVHTVARRQFLFEVYDHYYFNADGKVLSIKHFRSAIQDTTYTRFFYSDAGYIDSIYNGVDTIFLTYDTGYTHSQYDYSRKPIGRSVSYTQYPFAGKNTCYMRVRVVAKDRYIGTDEASRNLVQGKESSANIVYNKHVVHSNGSTTYFIGRHKMFEQYHGPMFNPSFDGLPAITLLHWSTPFGKISYSSKKKHLTCSNSTRNKYTWRTWHGKYIYKRR